MRWVDFLAPSSAAVETSLLRFKTLNERNGLLTPPDSGLSVIRSRIDLSNRGR